MSDFLYQSPDENLSDLQKYDAVTMRREAFRRSISADDALNLANVARYYFGVSPDLAVSMAQSGQDWDNPQMAEIAFDDAAQQDKSWADKSVGEKVYQATAEPIKAATRTAALVAEGLWEESIVSRGGRTAVRMAEGETNPLEAWKTAGPSDAALAVGQLAHGGRVNLGTGFLPQSTLAHETPGFGQELTSGIRELVDQGVAPQDAMPQAQEALAQERYGEIGEPISYQGRAAREAPKMVKVVNGKRYETSWSLGRAAALTIFTPDTIPSNVLSGSIDAAARVAWDPLNLPADEIAQAYKASKFIIPASVGDDFKQSWRPWVNAKTFDKWSNSRHGVATYQKFADLDDFRQTRKLLGDIPESVKLQVTLEKNPNKVRKILEPWLGGPAMREAPTFRKGWVRGPGAALGSVVHDKVITRFDPLENIASKWGQRMRKLGATSSEAVMTPMDPDRSIHVADQYLRTAEIPVEKAEEILQFMASNQAGDHLVTQRRAYDMITGAVEDRLVVLGYDPGDVTSLMSDWKGAQATNSRFLEDLIGNPIKMEGGLTMEIVGPTGEKFTVTLESAVSEAEFASHVVPLPNMRDARRLTSPGRATSYTTRKKLNLHFPNRPPVLKGMAAGRVTEKLDTMQAVWKNSVLMRGGWPMRVLSEELLRMQGSGYSQFMQDPLSFISLAIRNPEIVDITVDAKNLRGVFDDMGGLGASGFQSDMKNLPKSKAGQNLAHQNWASVQIIDSAGQVTEEGAEALSHMLLLYRGSTLRRTVAARGVEDSVRWLMDTPEGQQIIDEILASAPDTQIWKIKNEATLRRELQQIEFDLGIHLGGDGFYVSAEDLGTGQRRWRDRNGQEIPDFMAMSVADQRAWLVERNVRGRSSARTIKAQAELMWEHEGMPNFNQLNDEGRQFVTTNVGDEGLRKFVAYGDTNATVPVTGATAPTTGEIKASAEAVEAIPPNLLWDSMSVEELRIEWTRLQNIGEFDEAALLAAQTKGRIGKDIPQTDIPSISTGLDPADNALRNSANARQFTQEIRDYYNAADFAPPTKMKTVSTSLENRKKVYGSGVVDAIFNGIMTQPTNRAIRGPFATLRYTEEIAIAAAIGASDETFNQLRAWAVANKMEQYFDTFVAKTLKERGLKARPKIDPETLLNFDEIDIWAKTVAVENTKSLFFNIAERGNWSDMSRFMAPFSEAFFEVVSRWSDMLGIKSAAGVGKFRIGNPGQAIRNWERGRQTIEGARRTGFFQEDRFGQEGFFFPSIGNLWPGLDQWRGHMTANSLLFIDPSLTGVTVPGSGAFVQIGSSYLVPLIPDLPLVGNRVRKAAEELVFSGFPPPERTVTGAFTALLPTVGKRLEAMLKAPEQRGRNADNVGRSLQVMMQLRAQNGEPPPNKEEQKQMLEDAQFQGSLLSIFQFAESEMLPASMTYEPSVFIRDMEESGAPEFWMSVVALNDEWRAAQEVFQDDDEAQIYMLERYGVDPLNLTGANQTVLSRPLDTSRFDWLETNPLAREFAPTTLIGLIPVPDSTDFYSQAYAAAKQEGATVPKTSGFVMRTLSATNANSAWRKITDQFDTELALASYEYGVGSDGYGVRKQELEDWKSIEQKQLESLYFDWAPGGSPDDPQVWGNIDRPTYGGQFDELMAFTAPGPEQEWLAEMNPEMLDYLQFVDFVFERAGDNSVEVLEALGVDSTSPEEWWRRDDPESMGDNLQNKREIKDWVAQGLDQYVATNEVSDANRLNIEWMNEYIITRMIMGWEFDEVRVAVPSEIPRRSAGRVPQLVEETLDEIGPPLRDDEVDQYQEEVPSYG